ncbi:hypothetical protein ACVIGB_000937 [Bradyrhizobium sp. USDA 4341]
MKAELPDMDVVAYFKKKIAKAIPFGIEIVKAGNRSAKLHYIVEPTAVNGLNGDWLEALVIFDHMTSDRDVQKEIGLTAEVMIPMKQTDTVGYVAASGL